MNNYDYTKDTRPVYGEIKDGFLTGKNSFVRVNGYKRFDNPMAWYKAWQADNHIKNHFPDRYNPSCPHCANAGWVPGVRGAK